MCNKLSLDEILSLRCIYDYDSRIPNLFLSLKMITNWAEEEVIQGNLSESLLILASLGLDTKIDSDEIQLYLDHYLAENDIKRPTLNYSSLILFRIFVERLACSKTLEEMSELMSDMLFNGMILKVDTLIICIVIGHMFITNILIIILIYIVLMVMNSLVSKKDIK